jgi:hypothetical protein
MIAPLAALLPGVFDFVQSRFSVNNADFKHPIKRSYKMIRVILITFFGFMLLASFPVQANGRDGFHDKHYRSDHCKHKRHHNKHHGYHHYRHGDRRHGYRHDDQYRHARYTQAYRAPHLETGAYFEYSNDGVVLVYQSHPQRARGY